jgi:hypothetical protein
LCGFDADWWAWQGWRSCRWKHGLVYPAGRWHWCFWTLSISDGCRGFLAQVEVLR